MKPEEKQQPKFELERQAPCLQSQHVFAGYWWTVVTMTTVGYGDFYPTNWFGYGFAVLIMLAGLMLTSLPIAIIGGNFAVYHEYNQKRHNFEIC